MKSVLEINFMIDRKYDLVLYKSFDQFMQEFWHPAHERLQYHQMGVVEEDWWSDIRESPIDGVRYGVWAQIMPDSFPAVEVWYHELEERDPTQHPGEWMHRAG